MRRLNQSASWFSDISVSTDEDNEEEAQRREEEAQRYQEDVRRYEEEAQRLKQAAYQEALQNPERLAKVIGTSAAFLNVDGSIVYTDDDDDVEIVVPPHAQPGRVDPVDCAERRIVRSSSY